MVELVDGLEPGTRIGSVVLEEAIDRGGYGIVYRATHDLLGPVAVKEFFPRLVASRSRSSEHIVHSGSAKDAEAFDKGLQKFLEEGRTLETIDHPNVVKFHEVIEGNGTAYLVMALIVGDTLSDFITHQSDQINREFISRVAADIASALTAMHDQGFVHRDVAPDNILIEHRTQRPILIDFGGAKQVVSGHSMSSDAALVKPGFSPPEQYPKGDVKGLERGPWSDIYGLSAVLYNLVMGEEPQDAVTRMDSDLQVPAKKEGGDKADPKLLRAIDWGLNPAPQKRPRTVADWLKVVKGEAAPPKTGRARAVIGVVAVMIAAITMGYLLIDNADPEEDLIRAVRAGDCRSAIQYASQFPEGRYAAEAGNISDECSQRGDEEADWTRARDGNSISGFDTYLRKYPNGRYAVQAHAEKNKLEANAEERAWRQAERQDSIASYEKYRRDYRSGRYADNAQEKISTLRKRTRQIQSALQSMKFAPGSVDGDWGSNTGRAAAAFARVRGTSVESSGPNENLLSAVLAANSNGFSNVVCGTKQVSKRVPKQKCERVPKEVTDYDTEYLDDSDSCRPPPFCRYVGAQYRCDFAAAERWCEKAADRSLGSRLKRECRDLDGRPGSIDSSCDCDDSGCSCDTDMSCRVTTTKTNYEQECKTVYENQNESISDCKCLASESCLR